MQDQLAKWMPLYTQQYSESFVVVAQAKRARSEIDDHSLRPASQGSLLHRILFPRLSLFAVLPSRSFICNQPHIKLCQTALHDEASKASSRYLCANFKGSNLQRCVASIFTEYAKTVHPALKCGMEGSQTHGTRSATKTGKTPSLASFYCTS